ncbi:MAG: hypothetical protein ACYSTF_00625 [Planctomycetota bacterium]
MEEKERTKIRMENIRGRAKLQKRTPFPLSNRELKELEIPKEIWELPKLDLCEKLVLARIRGFGEEGGELTHEELGEFVWSKLSQITHILAKRSRVLSLLGHF